MATDFTVILSVRNHYGDEAGTFTDVDRDALFVGPTRSPYRFDCPNVDPNQIAFLMFQSRDVDSQQNIFQINGVGVFGGLPASPSNDAWNGNILLVEPRHRLKATGNELHVEARNTSGGGGGNIDDFIIDNVVIMYKTRASTTTITQGLE